MMVAMVPSVTVKTISPYGRNPPRPSGSNAATAWSSFAAVTRSGSVSSRPPFRARPGEAFRIAVGLAENGKALHARSDAERRDVALDAHAGRLVACVGAGAVEDEHGVVAAVGDDVRDFLRERAQATLDDGDVRDVRIAGRNRRIAKARPPDEHRDDLFQGVSGRRR